MFFPCLSVCLNKILLKKYILLKEICYICTMSAKNYYWSCQIFRVVLCTLSRELTKLSVPSLCLASEYIARAEPKGLTTHLLPSFSWTWGRDRQKYYSMQLQLSCSLCYVCYTHCSWFGAASTPFFVFRGVIQALCVHRSLWIPPFLCYLKEPNYHPNPYFWLLNNWSQCYREWESLGSLAKKNWVGPTPLSQHYVICEFTFFVFLFAL